MFISLTLSATRWVDGWVDGSLLNFLLAFHKWIIKYCADQKNLRFWNKNIHNQVPIFCYFWLITAPKKLASYLCFIRPQIIHFIYIPRLCLPTSNWTQKPKQIAKRWCSKEWSIQRKYIWIFYCWKQSINLLLYPSINKFIYHSF